MYGSILRIDTLRPRLSSSAPIDAEASPLPSDDTTPPVTKMNLVRLQSFAISPLRRSSSVARRASLVGYVVGQRGARPLQVGRRVDLDRRRCHLGDLDAKAPLQRAQLLELLRLLERRRREPGEAEQEVAPVRVQPDVLVAERAAGASAVAMVGQRAAREVERVAVAVGDHLHHVRVRRAPRACGSAVLIVAIGSAAVGAQRRDRRLDHRRVEQRQVALHVDDHVGVERARHLGDAVGAGAVRAAGHHHVAAEAAHRGADALVVGGDQRRARHRAPRGARS